MPHAHLFKIEFEWFYGQRSNQNDTTQRFVDEYKSNIISAALIGINIVILLFLFSNDENQSGRLFYILSKNEK